MAEVGPKMSEPSAFEQVTRKVVDRTSEDLKALEAKLEEALQNIYNELKELRNRPPVWVTIVFSLLFLMLGACLAGLWK